MGLARLRVGILTMNGETRPESTALPLDVLDQIDRICDRFEAMWEAGERPRVEDYLGGVDEPYQPYLRGDLLAAELAARRRRGEHPEPHEYQDRFSGEAALIVAAFGSPPMPISRPHSRIRRAVRLETCRSCK